jgi:hypothetical protein
MVILEIDPPYPVTLFPHASLVAHSLPVHTRRIPLAPPWHEQTV